jgi:3-demethoxyubiquinol 3-hydroxylase
LNQSYRCLANSLAEIGLFICYLLFSCNKSQHRVNIDIMNRLIPVVDTALRTLFAPARSSRAFTQPTTLDEHPYSLSDADKAHAGALMRVNHVGEICAQALYSAGALATSNPVTKEHFLAAAKEETDHLAWTQTRLDELGARPSLLNPLWYAGAFGLGLIAGKLGDSMSYGFVSETEAQVEAHLGSHLDLLPAGDHVSRAIVAHMKADEARHGQEAKQKMRELGAVALPAPVKAMMAAAAKVMTTVAYRI